MTHRKPAGCKIEKKMRWYVLDALVRGRQVMRMQDTGMQGTDDADAGDDDDMVDYVVMGQDDPYLQQQEKTCFVER